MKKRFSKLTHIFVLFLFLIGNTLSSVTLVQAQTGLAVAEMVLSNETPLLGETFTVDVYVDVSDVDSPDENLGAYAATLNWDPGILAYVSYSDAPPAGFTGVVNDSNAATGEIIFNGANASGATGNILLISLTFEAVGTGMVDLDLEFSELGAAITFTDIFSLLTVHDAALSVSNLIPGQVQLDGDVNVASSGSDTIFSFSHTTGSGDNRLMLIGVSWNSYNTVTSIEGATFTPDGESPVALSEVITQKQTDNQRYSVIYSLLDPPADQSGTVEITFNASVDYGIIGGAANFANVNQADPLGDPVGASSGTNDQLVTVTLSSLNGDELVFDNIFVGGNPPGNATVGDDQSQLAGWNLLEGNSGGAASIEQAVSDTVVMSWAIDAASMWVTAAVPINPAMVEPPTCYALSLSSGANGDDPTAVPDASWGCPAGEYSEGEDITLTAHPDTDYQVLAWIGTDDDVSRELTNQLTMPAAAAAVNVLYEPDPLASVVELDGAASSGTADGVDEISFAHTSGSGGNRLIMVGVSWNSGSNEREITSVEFSYGSGPTILSFDKVVDGQASSSSAPRNSAIFKSSSEPPAGELGTITIKFDGSVSNGIAAGAANFMNVDQATPIGPYDSVTGSNTASSLPLSGLDGDELVFDNLFQGASGESQVLTVGEGQTQLWTDYIGNTRSGASYEQAEGDSVTMSWSASSSSVFVLAAAAINPAPASESMRLTVDVEPEGSGTTVPVEGVHGYAEDSLVTVTADPAVGYVFDHWSGDCSGSGVCQVTMSTDRSVTANFVLEEYTLTIHTSGNGSVDLLPDQTTYHYGDSVELTANPDPEWLFESWSGDLSGSNNPETILIDGDAEVTATFIEMPEGGIEMEGSPSSVTSEGVSFVEFSHTTGTGVGRLLMVGVSANSYNDRQTITSITFTPSGGSALALSEVGSIENEEGRLSAIYDLVSPPSGVTGVVRVEFSGSVNYGIVAGAVNFSGVNTITPFDAYVSAIGTQADDLEVAAVTDPGDMVFDTVFMGAADPPALAPGAGQTEIWNSEGNRASGVASYEEAVSASTVMSWAPSGGSTEYYWAIGAVPINPMSGGTTYDLTIDVSPASAGTTSPAVGIHSYLESAVVDVTAEAASGYVFDSWSGACTGSDPCQITMDGNKSVTANFNTISMPIDFTGTELLGRPTDQSISIKIVPDEPISLFYEYGTVSGSYSGQTSTVAAAGGEPVTVVIDGLSANTEYFYRMQYSTDGGNTWIARDEYSFFTQRAKASSFTFDITTDSHVNILLGDEEIWEDTLEDVASDEPDFLIDMGDTFDIRSLSEGDVAGAESSYKFQLNFFNNISHSTPIYLIPGNHEQQEAWHLTGDASSLSVIGTNAQKKFYLNPVPDGSFYTGDPSTYPYLSGDQLKEDYYAWEWGDALFVVISPYWYTTTKPYVSDLGGGEDDWTGSGDSWDWTLGLDQFEWLKTTLEESDAKYKLIFMHQLVTDGSYLDQVDYGHGGANFAHLYEWGGYNENGTTWGWDTERPGWGDDPIHQVLLDNGVSAVFHAHDHQYAYEVKDGIVYQEVPSAGFDGDGFSGYESDDGYTVMAMENSGHLRVRVSPAETCVDYIQTGESSSAYTYCFEPPETMYELSIGADPSNGGTTSPAVGVHTYAENDVVPVSATPATGYEFDYWSGACEGSGACSVTMVADKSVTAHFALLQYTLSIGVTPSGAGTTSPAIGDHLYDYGSEVTINAVANPGYEFAYWSGDCEGTGTCEVTITENTDVLANFTRTAYNLTVAVDPAEGGTTIPSAGVHPYLENTQVAVVAEPAAGYVFDHWSGNCSGSGSCSVFMNGDKSVTAHFAEITYDLTINVLPEGAGTTVPAVGVHPYVINSEVSVLALPGSDYLFVEWTGACTGSEGCDLVMDEDKEVTANFILKTFDLTIEVEPAASGTTAPAVGVHTYDIGSVVDITPTPAAGYEFAYWSGDCTGTGACQVTIEDDTYVMAHFVHTTYDLTIVADPAEGGTTTPMVGVHPYLEGTPVVILAEPAAGYEFISWSGACSGSGACSVTMDMDKTVTANFAAITYDLTVDVDPAEGGTTVPAVGVHTYEIGSPVSVTAEAAEPLPVCGMDRQLHRYWAL